MGCSFKDKKGVSIVNAFQSILRKSNRKPNKIWADKGRESYNNSFKKWLQDNDIVMYSTHNEGKSVVAERFIKTLKNKIYKYMTSISRNVYIDKLDDIVNEYNNTYHRINDLNGEEIIGTFYVKELQKTNSALTAVENKIPDVSSLVKKTDYDTKISEIEEKVSDHNHGKYITTPEFNILAAMVFNARLAQAGLVTKTDFDAKRKIVDKKTNSNKRKHLLVETEFKK